MKNQFIASVIAFASVVSVSRADFSDTDSTVVSLPAFVVEATRVDLPSAEVRLSIEDTLKAVTRIADRTSDRAIDRLTERLSHGGRHYARGQFNRPRDRA